MEANILAELPEDIQREFLIRMNYEELMNLYYYGGETIKKICGNYGFWKDKLDYEIESQYYSSIEDIFFESCELGRYSYVVMLKEYYISQDDFYFLTEYGLELSIREGHKSIVEFLIQNGADIDNVDVKSIYLATKRGHINIVKFLFNYVSIKRKIDFQKCFELSVRGKYYELVDFFLGLGLSINERDIQHDFIDFVSRADTKMVSLLLKLKNFDPSFLNNASLREAVDKIESTIAKLILDHEKIQLPLKDCEEIFQKVLDHGSHRMVSVLLSHKNFKVGKIADDIMRSSVFQPFSIGLMKLVLSREDIDPTMNDNEALKSAVTNGYTNIIKLLLNDSRVRNSLTEEEIKKYEII